MAETGSTNVDLLLRAREGAPEGAVLVTDHQNAGRGRQARSWHDEPGNAMLMSVLLRPDPSFASLVPLLAGLAVVDGVTDVVAPPGGERPVVLKWPNDVLVPALGERKLAGILAEAVTTGVGGGDGEPASGLAVVVGTGLNLRWSTPPPAEVAARAAVLDDVSEAPVERWDLVRAVLGHLDRWLDQAEEAGPAVVLAAYRTHCVTIGRAVRFETPTGTVAGTASGVADDGGLVIDQEAGKGEITVRAGDAHHL